VLFTVDILDSNFMTACYTLQAPISIIIEGSIELAFSPYAAPLRNTLPAIGASHIGDSCHLLMRIPTIPAIPLWGDLASRGRIPAFGTGNFGGFAESKKR
jgi:hypothetical protein